jgi:alpha-ribazole phosphatase
MKLHLLRHPQPAVAAGLCYGASDIGVDPGALESVLAALRRAGLPGSLPVYTSPLRRCAELARRLAPPELHIDARLAEMDFGAWEMRAWSAIARTDVDAWNADLLGYRPGGAENVREVAQRVAAFRNALSSSGTREALVICHAGTIRLLLAMRADSNLEAAALHAAQTPHRIGYGELLVLEYADARP